MAAGSKTASNGRQGENQQSPANEYLNSASSQQSTSTAPFELEILDRAKATSDQWNTIGSYLAKNKRSQVEELKDEQGAIVVNWEDGQALQTEESVQALIDRLSKEGNRGAERERGSSSCAIV